MGVRRPAFPPRVQLTNGRVRVVRLWLAVSDALFADGRYTVQVQAVDLLNHYTRVERPLTVKPRKRRT